MDELHRQLAAFYQVILHRGIAKAARTLQAERSSLSRHVNDLERHCGQLLFHRHPFRVTHAGRALFEDLDAARRKVGARLTALQQVAAPHVHLMASEVVTQTFLPGITHALEARHPGLRCSVTCGDERQIREELTARAIHAAIAPEHDDWGDLSSERLVELPLVLLIPRGQRLPSVGELWMRSPVPDVLFVPAQSPSVEQAFDAGLAGLQVAWPNRRRVSSGLAVRESVAHGFGFGLVVDLPPLVRGVRALPLLTFPRVPIAAFWAGRKTPVHATMLEQLRAVAKSLGASSLALRKF